MALTAQQRNNAQTIIRVGRQSGASNKQILSALTAALTEARLQNPAGGDRDSQGAFQIRTSMHPGVNARDVAASASWFYQQAKGADKGQNPADLAQAVERSAYPQRYAPNLGTAQQLLGGGGGSAPSGGGSGLRTVLQQKVQTLTLPAPQVTQTPQINPVVSTPNIQGPKANIVNLPAPPAQPQTETYKIPVVVKALVAATQEPGGATVPHDQIGRIMQRANAINAAHVPYQWGGGHGSAPAKPGVPLDCSGAVSAVLGIRPRVSGDMGTIGKPGPGNPNQGVTIFYSPQHTFLRINGHFFGTSSANQGGGPGWIPQSQISPAYLAGFKARHL